MKKLIENLEGNLVGIYALLASLFMAGIYLIIAEIDIGLPIVVFIGTLITGIVAGIIFPGILKLYSVVIVALSGTIIFATCCI